MGDSDVGENLLAARSAVTAALLLGVATVVLFMALPHRGTRFVLLAVVIALGVAIMVAASRAFGRLAYAIGPGVCRGIGGAAIVLGAYLSGPLLVDVFGRDTSPAVLVLVTFLPPLLALLALAGKGFRAGVVGAALVAPTVLVLLLALAGIGPGTTALSLLALAIVAAAVAVPAASAWSTAGIVAGATAAAAAIGGGATPLGVLAGPAAVVPAPGMRALVIVAGLLLVALFGVLAMLRRDTAGGVLTALALTVPVADDAVIGAPLAVAVAAASALALPQARRLADRAAGVLRPGGATSAAALWSVLGVAVLVVAARGSFLGERAQSALVVAALGLAVVMAVRLPGMPGAVLACAALVGLQVTSPWRQLIAGAVDTTGDPFAHVKVIVGVTLLAAVTAAWLLVRAHLRVGVIVAAAYLLAGTLADLVRAIALMTAHSPEREAAWTATMVLPLLAISLPAAVTAIVARGPATRAAGQAVAALMLAIGGLTLLKLLLRTVSREAADPMSVLTPTDFGALTSLDGAGLPVALGVAGLLVPAVAAILSTAHRPSPALTAACALFAVAGTQVTLAVALAEGGTAAFDLILWTVLAVSAVVTAAAVSAVRSTPSPLAAG